MYTEGSGEGLSPLDPLAAGRARLALPAVERLVADHLRPAAVVVDAVRAGPVAACRCVASAPLGIVRLSA